MLTCCDAVRCSANAANAANAADAAVVSAAWQWRCRSISCFAACAIGAIVVVRSSCIFGSRPGAVLISTGSDMGDFVACFVGTCATVNVCAIMATGASSTMLLRRRRHWRHRRHWPCIAQRRSTSANIQRHPTTAIREHCAHQSVARAARPTHPRFLCPSDCLSDSVALSVALTRCPACSSSPNRTRRRTRQAVHSQSHSADPTPQQRSCAALRCTGTRAQGARHELS